ncbi:hypothetical protein D8674_042249 [Pyrus ussuriensis x Pyrus communis]|uniref:Cytochrome P450 71A1-like n=1 Tax=Pyrus ussuriensis x Pyrus communis TaxID=2448454 RepID=A0A5N5FTS9_9ROSA|nr:hypothetical protein D8674_042249 [Pyrus ussuriensis x Pyrus communis]
MALIAPFFIWLPFLLLLIPLLQLKKKQHLPNKPQKQNPLPPSPPKLPLIGNLHQLGSSLHQSLWQLSKNRPSSTGARRLTYNYLDIGFSPYVQSYRKIREEEVDKMVNSISASSSSGVPVDLMEKLFAFAASIIFRIAILRPCSEACTELSWIGWVIDRVSGVHKELDRTSKELDGFFQQNLFLGGIDVWAMAELANNPGLMKKAQEEVRKCIGNKGKVTETETDHLQYLKMVIKETLRLHPPAPMILPRETASRCKIQGYDIDPKTLVLVNAWAIARDLRFWKDPEEFIPERFDGSSVDYKGQHFEFLPFGAGRRVCPGIYIWERQRWSLDLQIFSWKLPDGMEEDLNMEETSGSLSLTVSKKTPLNLIPVKFCQKE